MEVKNESLSINTSCQDLQLLNPKILPFTRLEASAVRPSDPRAALSQRGKETSRVSEHQALVTSTVPTLHSSLLYTCAPQGPADNCIHTNTHTHTHYLNAYFYMAPVHVCVCVCTDTSLPPVLTAQQH